MNRFISPALMSALLVLGTACTAQTPHEDGAAEDSAAVAEVPDSASVAVFAGGCFWCMEGPFESVDGVFAAVSGYTGGPEVEPAYEDVARGRTGHVEAVRVMYDPEVVSYEALLDIYWRSMDPTDGGGQFADRGAQYAPAIFVANAAEREAAEASKAALASDGPFDEPIVVPIRDAQPFYDAEAYHQDYYLTNTSHYQAYRRGSGREAFLAEHWGAAH